MRIGPRLAIMLAVALAPGVVLAEMEPEAPADVDDRADRLVARVPAGESDEAVDVSDERWQRVMDNLADERYEVRQRQTRQLLREAELDLRAIVQLYLQAELAEQRHRLRAVLRHHVLRRHRERNEPGGDGALGISHRGLTAEQAGRIGRPVVEVLATMAGMPAYVELEPGDMIIGFDGQSLEPDTDGDSTIRQPQAGRPAVHIAGQPVAQNVAHRLSQLIQRRSPGSEIELTIIRDGREQRLRVTLTGNDALRTMYDSQVHRLQGEYATAWTRFRDGLESLTEPIRHIDLDVEPGQ